MNLSKVNSFILSAAGLTVIYYFAIFLPNKANKDIAIEQKKIELQEALILENRRAEFRAECIEDERGNFKSFENALNQCSSDDCKEKLTESFRSYLGQVYVDSCIEARSK